MHANILFIQLHFLCPASVYYQLTNSQIQFNRNYGASQPFLYLWAFTCAIKVFKDRRRPWKAALWRGDRSAQLPETANAEKLIQVSNKSRSWEDREKTAACKCRPGLKSMWGQHWNCLINWFQQSSWELSTPEKAGCSLKDLNKSFLAELLKTAKNMPQQRPRV